MDIYMEKGKLEKVSTSNNIRVSVGLGFCRIRTVDFMRLYSVEDKTNPLDRNVEKHLFYLLQPREILGFYSLVLYNTFNIYKYLKCSNNIINIVYCLLKYDLIKTKHMFIIHSHVYTQFYMVPGIV